MSAKFTPWFDGRTKPARKGVYERYLSSANRYSFWDGRKWAFSGSTIKAAQASRGNGDSCYQDTPWRGLASDPSKVAK
jgi:hypothetical protein